MCGPFDEQHLSDMKQRSTEAPNSNPNLYDIICLKAMTKSFSQVKTMAVSRRLYRISL